MSDFFILIISYLNLLNEFLANSMRFFVEKVTAKRQECADRGETAMSACYKLVVNSSYGRLGMNLSKRVRRKYVTAKNLNKELKKSRFIGCQPISDDSEIFEVSLKKARQTDSIPVQTCKPNKFFF